MLNRLGICASSETHARYVQYRVEKRNKDGPMAGFPADSFMVVSADNLDFIHSYSRVYSGKQGCSWHGTTVQIVQPKPTTLSDITHTPMEVNTHTDPLTHSNDITRQETSLEKRPYSTRSPNLPLEACSRTDNDDTESMVSSSSDGSSVESRVDDEVDRLMTDIFGSSEYDDEELHSVIGYDSD